MGEEAIDIVSTVFVKRYSTSLFSLPRCKIMSADLGLYLQGVKHLSLEDISIDIVACVESAR